MSEKNNVKDENKNLDNTVLEQVTGGKGARENGNPFQDIPRAENHKIDDKIKDKI